MNRFSKLTFTALAALLGACLLALPAAAQEHGHEDSHGHEPGSSSADMHAADGHADAAHADEHGADEHGAGGHSDASHGEDGHGAETAEIPHLPDLLGTVHHLMEGSHGVEGIAPEAAHSINEAIAGTGLNDPMGGPFKAFEHIFYAALIIIALIIVFSIAGKQLRAAPAQGQRMTRLAMFAEIVVTFFEDFFGAILGKQNVRRHLPFIGTLFIYILCCNLFGLVFLGHASTSNLSFNLGMAVLVFFYVHGSSIAKSPMGYLAHYPGALPSAKELGLGVGSYFLIGFMAILFIVIHVMEALIQPMSLSLRLFGNVLGKDVLLGVFGGLLQIPIGDTAIAIPLHIPFLFLGLLLGAVQALIFSLLSAVYITLWEPHEHHHDEHHHEEHGHGHSHGHAHA
ncbi:F0F1 ATP synthase subunit A [bacterium]|nr:F0F1 ATP synthase subunit A [bacterium]